MTNVYRPRSLDGGGACVILRLQRNPIRVRVMAVGIHSCGELRFFLGGLRAAIVWKDDCYWSAIAVLAPGSSESGECPAMACPGGT